jgi:hypothetical protein
VSYVAVKKVFKCVFCGVEEVEQIELHWSIWDQLVHETPDMALLEENGSNLWRLGKVCDACYARGKPYKKDEIAESFFDQLTSKEFLLIKEK